MRRMTSMARGIGSMAAGMALVLAGCGSSQPPPEEPPGDESFGPESDPGTEGPEDAAEGPSNTRVGTEPCTQDSDCVAAACCHASACVARTGANAPSCA